MLRNLRQTRVSFRSWFEQHLSLEATGVVVEHGVQFPQSGKLAYILKQDRGSSWH